VDPPVRVVVREILTETDPARGYLTIEVPPSPDAPHAVGGAFRGRSGTTNTILTATEVRRFHEQVAEAAPPPLLEELRIFVGLDPTQEEQRQQAHLFVLARPLRVSDEMLSDIVGERWEAWTREHVHNAPRLTAQFSPDFSQAHRLVRTPLGWIATHYEAVHQPPEPLRENYGIEIEIGDNGSIRLFCSRASDYWKGTRVVLEILIGGLVRRVIELAAVISADAGFVGDWEIGAALANLQGAVSHFRMQNWMVDAEDCTPYPEYGYERTWRGSAADLNAPEPIVTRLIGPLNRVLNDGRCPMPMPA
jgi:hypothetical protein